MEDILLDAQNSNSDDLQADALFFWRGGYTGRIGIRRGTHIN